MVQKCSLIKVMEIFFIEPNTVHFIKEISRKINLAPTSVRNNIKELLKKSLIKKKKAKPFDGYAANRDDNDFIFYKRLHNLYSLKELARFLTESYYPKLIVVFGSYSLGEDVETSDVDMLILTQGKKEIDITRFEKKLKKRINIMHVKSLDNFEKSLRKKIYNGVVLYGGF